MEVLCRGTKESKTASKASLVLSEVEAHTEGLKVLDLDLKYHFTLLEAPVTTRSHWSFIEQSKTRRGAGKRRSQRV